MKAIRARGFTVPMLLGAVLAVLVAANAWLQYSGFQAMRARMAERAQRSHRPSPPAAPVETNLVLNSAAAFALLGTLGVLSARSRYLRRAERWQQQLEQGRAVQSQLMPRAGATLPDVDVAAEFVPALEVGGDLYDVFAAAGGRVAFAVGDVSGKGLPAALLTGLIHGALRTNAWQANPASNEAFAQQLNSLLCGRTLEARYATLFWGAYDPAAGRLTYINAGHCPGFVVRRERVQRLDSSGPVLGLLPHAQYREVGVDFEPGDVLVLYSDGIVEAANHSGEEYGEERLRRVLEHCTVSSAAEVRAAILDDLRAFLGGGAPDDDLTLLALEAQPATVALSAAA
jgi:sigma-B regulation protein RsbU (phosphoserine phosphatase)